MKESGFAFLPVCAGSLLMLVSMGKEIPLFLLVMCVSTLIPLDLRKNGKKVALGASLCSLYSSVPNHLYCIYCSKTCQ